MRTPISIPALAVIAVLASPAAAEPAPPGNPALAHDLFDQGRALMAQRDYVRACAKFEESRKADPGSSGGGGTLLNLALCNELLGKTGTAWALFRTARSLAIRDRREDRKAFAEEHITQLAPKLVRLRVVVRSDARFVGLEVLRGGVSLGDGEWNEALVVDPGEHVVEARAPGRLPFRTSVIVEGEGVSRDVEVPVLAEAPLKTRIDGRPIRDRATRVAATLVGGAGLAAMAVGGVFAVRAIDRQNESDDLCPDYDHCNPAGISLSADAASDARVALSTMIGGGLVLAAGVVLYLTAPVVKPPPGGVTSTRIPTSLRIEF